MILKYESMLACMVMLANYTTPTMPLYYTTRDIAWMMDDMMMISANTEPNNPPFTATDPDTSAAQRPPYQATTQSRNFTQPQRTD